jgi:hypothetical protein
MGWILLVNFLLMSALWGWSLSRRHPCGAETFFTLSVTVFDVLIVILLISSLTT